MLKAIKTTKQLRLDELIKYVWENDIRNKIFSTDNNQTVKFLGHGRFESCWNFGSDDLFEVEIEEEITEETLFDLLVEIYFDDEEYHSYVYRDRCVKHLKDSNSISFYGLINGKLELIWERENQ